MNNGPTGLKVNVLKDMRPETAVVLNGETKAKVVIGGDGTHTRQAARVVERVEAATGARLEVVRAADAAAGALLEGHVVALGNMADNDFIRWLYYQWWAVEDRCYPGRGGYALRTLHNPLGNGYNVVLLGASDEAGLDRVVSRFVDLVADEETFSLGWTMEIRLGPEFDAFSRPPEGWLQERREDFIARATAPHASEAGAGFQLISEAGAYGLMYHRTGHEAYASAVLEIAKAHLMMGEYGVMAHFHVWWLAVVWDLIEESPVFSDEDRLKITQYLLWIMDSEEGAYTRFFREGVGHRMVRQNHQTLVALAAWFGGRYFLTHYGFEEGKEWMAASADVFKGQAESFKPVEDANAYQWMTLDHILTYTLASGDTTYIENGNCKRSLDQAVLYCNNRGALPAFGDTGAPMDGYPTNFVAKAGHVLQDGRAVFLLGRRFDRPSDYFRPQPPGERYEAVRDPLLVMSFEKYFDDGLPPEVPEGMAGVQVLEVAGGFYDLAEDPRARPREVKPLNLPKEEAFDTVCFREGFGRDDQYLMLHGIYYGNHSHEDGNTIPEFSANDRIFLVDASYTEGPTLKHHNGVTAVRDGKAWDVPALCRLDGVADLDRVGMSRTSADGDWGALWVRNIVWQRGRYFVVVDEVEATKPGAFALQCHWRTLGTPALKDGILESVQRDPETGREDRFVLQSVGGGRMSLERDWENFGHWWDAYPHTDDYVNILRESANREMAVGDRHTFINLFYASNTRKPVDDRMRRVGESAVAVEGSQGRMLVGTGGGTGAFEVGSISGRAEIYAAGDGWFALCNGTSLCSECAIFESEHPVSIEFDLERGEGIVVTPRPAEITLNKERLHVAAGRQEVKTHRPGAGVFSMGGTADVPAYEADFRTPAPAASAPGLHRVWRYDAGSGVRCAAANADGVVLGTVDGRVLALDDNGRPAWSFQAEGPVLSVCPADLDGRRCVIAGADDRRLYLLEEGGGVQWSRGFEIFRGTWDRYARNSAVEFVTAADLRGDGRTDILAAVSDRQLHCIDATGDERWSFMIYGIFAPLRVADLNGDGRQEVIGGPGRITCGGTCYVLDADGAEVASNGLDGWASMMPACDVWVRGDEHLIACGTNRSHVFGLKLDGNRLETLWKLRVGEEVNAVCAADVDGDSRPEVLVGSDCFYIYLLDEHGKERWRRNLAAPVQQVMVAERDGDAKIAAGCEDGSVWVLDGDGRTLGLHRAESEIHTLTAHEESRLLIGCSDGTLSLLSV
ncbi:MAG: hypothetical protein OXH06_14065 [Gemmatimonadetes bacterium]|nr:hypothetical protein [Gemmatimonadota bacterium]MDE3259638.1 hypothetical protein [Gemmatimonadota bacterium]